MRAAAILVEISPGELIDRLTILRIKRARVTDRQKLRNVITELRALEETHRAVTGESVELEALTSQLAEVNESLWEAEDAVRECERRETFDGRFVAHARSIYRLNDRRSALKRRINQLLGSRLVEEKEYST